MIDPNRRYRTRDGQAVRIYATDGADPFPVHGAVLCPDNDMGDGGGWLQFSWRFDGGMRHPRAPDDGHPSDLVEVTLADELRDQIPWSVLRQPIRYIVFDPVCGWWGFQRKPEIHGDDSGWAIPLTGAYFDLNYIVMPGVDPARWRETLVERPEDEP